MSGRKRQESAVPPYGIRDTLFGDMPLATWAAAGGDEPWASFRRAEDAIRAGRHDQAVSILMGVTAADGLESRHTLQAWSALRELGTRPPAAAGRTVLGVVVEVPMDAGLDLLAAYADRSARYYNHGGGGVVWERADDRLDGPIDGVLAAGQAVADRIGPWEGPRPAPPGAGRIRLNMLTPSGIHFGEGPHAGMAADPVGGPLVEAATALMLELVGLLPRGERRPS
ncbi:MAG TPA: hypothetical protein VIC57_18700 [Candidatus Dormibacteraeota bacterium]|jgi:hypothetical protein